MNAIDNLMFTTKKDSRYTIPGQANPHLVPAPKQSIFWPAGLNLDGTVSQDFPVGNGLSAKYDDLNRYSFITGDDTDLIEDAIQKHWFDIGYHVAYINDATNPIISLASLGTPPTKDKIFADFLVPPYHMMYAYLMENTRIAQIFEKLLQDYLHDEKLSKTNNEAEFRWLVNTENLFYKDLPHNSYRNISGVVRPLTESSRRNAYQRLFGVDLGFGDFRNNNAAYPYTKADIANQAFIAVFESFIAEFWQAYINARNSVGPNTTDIVHLTETAQHLQEMLMARRTYRTDFLGYRFYNLSREEFSSVIMMSWLHYAVATDGPIVTWLGCNGNTAGERLINIGNKVGLPAHSKSVSIIEIAAPAAALLRSIEIGSFNDEPWLNQVIHANVPGFLPAPSNEQKEILSDILIIINNWEAITGHRIKNPDAAQKVAGTVRVEQKQPMKPTPVMN